MQPNWKSPRTLQAGRKAPAKSRKASFVGLDRFKPTQSSQDSKALGPEQNLSHTSRPASREHSFHATMGSARKGHEMGGSLKGAGGYAAFAQRQSQSATHVSNIM